MADRATAPNIEIGVIGDINPTPYEIIFSIPISDTDFNIGPQLFLSILSLIDWENFTKSFKEVTTLKLLDNLSTISYCFF